MAQLVLIRPGATNYDDDGRIQGVLDIPLNAHGHAEAAEMAAQLRGLGIEAVYSTQCLAARETARTIAEALGVRLRWLDRLGNVDQGLWQGMRVADVRRKQPKVYRLWQEAPDNICPPAGEVLAEAEQRVRAAVDRLHRRHKQATVALVVREPMASLVRRYVLRNPLGDLWKASVEHGRWELLVAQPAVALQSG